MFSLHHWAGSRVFCYSLAIGVYGVVCVQILDDRGNQRELKLGIFNGVKRFTRHGEHLLVVVVLPSYSIKPSNVDFGIMWEAEKILSPCREQDKSVSHSCPEEKKTGSIP